MSIGKLMKVNKIVFLTNLKNTLVGFGCGRK
jgi:hypothetical protein